MSCHGRGRGLELGRRPGIACGGRRSAAGPRSIQSSRRAVVPFSRAVARLVQDTTELDGTWPARCRSWTGIVSFWSLLLPSLRGMDDTFRLPGEKERRQDPAEASHQVRLP